MHPAAVATRSKRHGASLWGPALLSSRKGPEEAASAHKHISNAHVLFHAPRGPAGRRGPGRLLLYIVVVTVIVVVIIIVVCL